MSAFEVGRVFKLVIMVFVIFIIVYTFGIYLEHEERREAERFRIESQVGRESIIRMQIESNNHLEELINATVSNNKNLTRFFVAYILDVNEEHNCLTQNQDIPINNRSKCEDRIINNYSHYTIDNVTVIPLPVDLQIIKALDDNK